MLDTLSDTYLMYLKPINPRVKPIKGQTIAIPNSDIHDSAESWLEKGSARASSNGVCKISSMTLMCTI